MLLTVRPGSHYLAHELAAEALVVQGGEVRVLNSQSHQDLIPLLDKVLPPYTHGTARVTITRHNGGTKCNDSLSERVGGGQVPHAFFLRVSAVIAIDKTSQKRKKTLNFCTKTDCRKTEDARDVSQFPPADAVKSHESKQRACCSYIHSPT